MTYVLDNTEQENGLLDVSKELQNASLDDCLLNIDSTLLTNLANNLAYKQNEYGKNNGGVWELTIGWRKAL